MVKEFRRAKNIALFITTFWSFVREFSPRHHPLPAARLTAA